MKRFWELEKCDLKRTLTKEEAECERHFESTTYRDEDGRFVVSLPLKGKIQDLGESEYNTMKRQKSIERRFMNDSMFQLYKIFAGISEDEIAYETNFRE